MVVRPERQGRSTAVAMPGDPLWISETTPNTAPSARMPERRSPYPIAGQTIYPDGGCMILNYEVDDCDAAEAPGKAAGLPVPMRGRVTTAAASPI